MKKEFLILVALMIIGAIFTLIGVPSIVYCANNAKEVTPENWVASFMLSVGGIAILGIVISLINKS